MFTTILLLQVCDSFSLLASQDLTGLICLGDWMRNSAPDLEAVIDAGVSLLAICFSLSYKLDLIGSDHDI